MILFLVGSHYEGFDRLVKVADWLASQTDEQVVVQFGSSRYRPRVASGFDFCDHEALSQRVSEADVIVTHGGIGSILLCIDSKKPFIIFPRKKSRGEALDDHQDEIAEELQKRGLANVANDKRQVAFAVKHPGTCLATPADSSRQSLLRRLRSFVDEMA